MTNSSRIRHMRGTMHPGGGVTPPQCVRARMRGHVGAEAHTLSASMLPKKAKSVPVLPPSLSQSTRHGSMSSRLSITMLVLPQRGASTCCVVCVALHPSTPGQGAMRGRGSRRGRAGVRRATTIVSVCMYIYIDGRVCVCVCVCINYIFLQITTNIHLQSRQSPGAAGSGLGDTRAFMLLKKSFQSATLSPSTSARSAGPWRTE